jgi:enamine deaminase RidA (YjgF/YER057c/UK114 family)
MKEIVRRNLDIGIARHIGTYSDGVVVETRDHIRRLVSAGTPGMRADGTIPKDFKGQAELAWSNAGRLLDAAEMTRDDLVSITQYLVRREDVQVHGPIRKAFLGEARPASMLMLVAGLPWPDMLIEIRVEAIAA